MTPLPPTPDPRPAGEADTTEADTERLQRVAQMAARFYTFTHGGYRWEADDEKRDNLYDALRAVGYGAAYDAGAGGEAGGR